MPLLCLISRILKWYHQNNSAPKKKVDSGPKLLTALTIPELKNELKDRKVKIGKVVKNQLADKLKAFSYRVLKDDCLDLPDKVYIRREVDLTDEQSKAYAKVVKRWRILNV